MSFAEVLDQLPALTVSQRQQLILRVLELDELPLSRGDEKLVEKRLATHRLSPDSAVSMDQMKTRLRLRQNSKIKTPPGLKAWQLIVE